MALPSPSDETKLLASVLAPLLEDFQYWFGRSLQLLEQTGSIGGLSTDQQAHLTERLRQALAETQTAAALLKATDGQVGVDTAQVMGWHRLVAECWALARRHRAASA
ncbi:MAG TPA: DUF2605 domain-containing protein [Leptolyngbyaceae cyanobacterium M65_K2018_010]|nr:DUF2605 domain-containing protein [Leptolyngbyaceae cyanobacterium M65_K2018_010]